MRLTNLNKTNSPTLTAAETYDPYGNRTLQTVTVTPGGVTTTTTPSDGTTNRIASGNGVTYDALGNIRSENSNTYTYDAENRITSVTGSASATYNYDAFGRRIRKVVGTNIYDYLYDLSGHVVVGLKANAVQRVEIFAGDTHLATYNITANKTYFSHTNYIGSERVKTDQTGAVAEDCKYLPFGEYNGTCSSAAGSPYHYAGNELDGETGLYHMWYRYYNPRIGRFMSADPLNGGTGDPQSLNKFGYAGNDPINASDPLGLCAQGDRGARGQCVHEPYHNDSVGGAGLSWGCSACGYGIWYAFLAESNAATFTNGRGYDLPGQDNEIQRGLDRHVAIITRGYDPEFPLLGQEQDRRPEQHNVDPAKQAQCVAQAVSTATGVTVNPVPELSNNSVGGHLNVALVAADLSSSTWSAVISGAQSSDGLRLGLGTHVHHVFTDQISGQIVGVYGHIDLFNPTRDLAGLIGHFAVDVLFGQLAHKRDNGLDKGCGQ